MTDEKPDEVAQETADVAREPGDWLSAVRPYALLIGLFLLIYGLPQSFHVANSWATSTFGYLANAWTVRPDASHGWLVLPAIVFLVGRLQKDLAKLPRSSHPGGLILVAIALLLHSAEVILDIDGPSPLSVPIFLAGAVWYLFGTAWLRALAFPLAYISFLIPVPGGLTQVVTFPLRMLATESSKALVAQFGVATVGSGMNIEFMQPHGFEYVRLAVADPCSGIHSIMAIKALHAITANFSRLSIGWKWVLFMLALPITLAANVLRMTLIIVICAYVSKKVGMLFHDYSPYVLFLFVFLILISMGRAMEWATRPEGKNPGSKLVARGFLAVCLFLAVSGFPFLMHLAGHTKAGFLLIALVAAGYGVSVLIGKLVRATDRPNRAPNKVAIASLMALGAAATLWGATRTPYIAIAANVKAIPTEAGAWRSVGDIPADPETMKQIEADSYIHRLYVRPDGQQVEFMVVYRRYGRREFAHRPDQCYPAGGYVGLKKDTTTLSWAGRQDKAVHWLFDGSEVARADGGKGVPVSTVSYFFVSGNRSESDFIKQQLWMAVEQLPLLGNKNGWTFLRLSSPRVTTDDDALLAQKDFLAAIEGDVRKIITTDPSTAGPVGDAAR